MAQTDVNDHGRFAVSLKTRQKTWREPEPPVRYAYLKLLREHDKTRRVYDIDPYAEVYQFRDNVYSIYQESLDGMGDVWSHLIIGPKKAMLIDTGFGIGDLKGLCSRLTGGMELIVVCTHAHFDHAYGNHQFGKVYCSEFEVPNMQKTLDPHIWDYLTDEKGQGVWCDFDVRDLIPYQEYEIVGLPDHSTFDLGEGYLVELIHTGGHTPGHAMYLDHQSHILFAGDDACYGNLSVGACAPTDPFYKYATVEAMRDRLQGIVNRGKEVEYIFPGHVAVDIRPVMLQSIIEACDAVVKDPDSYDARSEFGMGGEPRITLKKMIFESGYLMYGPGKVYMNPQEK